METLKPKTREAVLQIAEWQLGYTENPAGSNKTKYGAVYGLNGQPWCLMFVWWVFNQAGFNLYHTASCTALYNRYKTYSPHQVVNGLYRPGDIVLYDFSGKKAKYEHCGIVVDVSVNGKTLTVIEGNTSLNNQSNGGEVMRRSRSASLVSAAIRPNYPD